MNEERGNVQVGFTCSPDILDKIAQGDPAWLHAFKVLAQAAQIQWPNEPIEFKASRRQD